MKKSILAVMFVVTLMLLCTVPVQAWQGRVAGMGGVYGLVEDESDFLTHPAGIADGKGLNFYSNMQLRSQTTDKFSYSYRTAPAATPGAWTEWNYDASGREIQYEGHFGGAFPVGPGRMGVFLQYTGFNGNLRGDFVGSTYTGFTTSTNSFDQEKRLDDLALRVIYGIPVNKNLKLGTEFQIDYKKEKSTTKRSYGGNTYINETYGFSDSPVSLLYLGVPYDSRYYEASMKASVETMIGPAKASFTARGGMPFSSENDYYYLYNSNFGGDHDGKIKGHNFGADAWVRVPVSNTLALPFLVTFDYKKLNRKAEGREMLGWTGFYGRHIYRDESKTFTAGGGVDYTPAQGTKVAGGLYYTYLKDTTDFVYAYSNYPNVGSSWNYFDHSGYPETKEHKISFKGAVEKAISSDITLNGGFNTFYGWMKQTHEHSFASTSPYVPNLFSSSAKGKRWGANASLGASFKAGATTMEPYVAGGFERISLSGDGGSYSNGVLSTMYPDNSLKKNTWFIGGGFALRF
jgi:hypothetical protein